LEKEALALFAWNFAQPVVRTEAAKRARKGRLHRLVV
jgi:hypothetical protein